MPFKWIIMLGDGDCNTAIIIKGFLAEVVMGSYLRVVQGGVQRMATGIVAAVISYNLAIVEGCGKDFEQAGEVGFNNNGPNLIYNKAVCDAACEEVPSVPPAGSGEVPGQPNPTDAARGLDALFDSGPVNDASWGGLCLAYGNSGDGSICYIFAPGVNEFNDGTIGCDKYGAWCCRAERVPEGLPNDYCVAGNYVPGGPRVSLEGKCADQSVYGIEKCEAYVRGADLEVISRDGVTSCNQRGTPCCYVELGDGEEQADAPCLNPEEVEFYNPRSSRAEQRDQ